MAKKPAAGGKGGQGGQFKVQQTTKITGKVNGKQAVGGVSSGQGGQGGQKPAGQQAAG